MKSWIKNLAALAVFGMAIGLANATPSAQEILAASDLVRNPDFPFGMTNTLVEYRNGKQTDSSTLGIYSKADNKQRAVPQPDPVFGAGARRQQTDPV